ncbi:MAG: NAD(P)/FAD-dependent oxidoreductase [Oscillospiraceae bacterium]|nr:NAD(P)/FAD-dependent oxidoreductase [Oscillospiraceae bacterium]
MIKTDVIVIGAGLLGCFAARNLAGYDMGIIVLEKEDDVCRGISKANTGIIYSGYDHKPGSKKAKLCVQANEAFDLLCDELEVPFKRPGSIMVSYGPKGDAVIARKYRDGLEGAVKGIKLLSGSEAEAMEPALAKGITSALYCSETGTIDPWELCIAAYENARDNGVRFVFSSPVTDVKRENGGFTVQTEGESYFAKALVNAAGLSSDSIREMTEKPLIRLFPSAADYIVLDRRTAGEVEHIVFHEGEDGKGLTIVLTVDGNLLIGPTNREASESETEERDMRTDSGGIDHLKELCGSIVPELDLGMQIRTFGSLRPDPYYVSLNGDAVIKKDDSIKDIRITEEDGLYSLIGVKTPGLTFSNELGKIVADRAAAYVGKTDPNRNFDPHRKAIVRARDLTEEERAELIMQDSGYGEVICSCMDVTKSEILQAIERGAHDYESVKRRTGAGFGRCQGSRCRRRIMDLISKGE